MKTLNRREFIAQTAAATVSAAALLNTPLARAAAQPKRLMTIDLVCGAIGVSANQLQAIDLAARHGFESVGADAGYLSSLSAAKLEEVLAMMREKKVRFGAAGLTVEFRQDDAKFEDGMAKLPKIADGLKLAGVTRVSTWLTPASDQLTYIANFRQHARRLRAVASVLNERGIRLGLEYVGPKTSWSSRRYPFIHSMAELSDLIAEIGLNNVGYVLDSWHWWNAEETDKDILALKGTDVVAVDLNDAPAGIPREQQVDSRRELPCATGMIDVAAFLRAIHQIGYDGPVRAEPFNQALNKLDNEEACATVAASMRKAFALAFGDQ